MNSNGSHLLNYFKAKCIKAYRSYHKQCLGQDERDSMQDNYDIELIKWWADIMNVFGIKGSEAEDAAVALCKRPLKEEEWDCLKLFFQHQGGL